MTSTPRLARRAHLERLSGWVVSTLCLVVQTACGSATAEVRLEARTEQAKAQMQTGARAAMLTGATTGTTQGDRQKLCNANSADFEVSEYDTSGDDVPDVRKVFRRMGVPPLTRLAVVCRENDLNADGTKDVLRFYDEEGRPLREETDRDFDGKMDELTTFQEGHVVRKETDTTGNGIVDTKIFYEDGEPLRAERDLAARSTVHTWRPNRWEYYEARRTVRMGTDLDGDGKVDRWDRDDSLRAPKDKEEEQSEDEEAEEEETGEGAGEEASPDTKEEGKAE